MTPGRGSSSNAGHLAVGMPAAEPEYVTGPDGLPARVVGTWVDQKVHYVDEYARLFGTAMKKKFPRRAYVELFAGPGLSMDRHHPGRFLDGSAIRALGANFTDYAFVDIAETAFLALEERLQRLDARKTRRIGVFMGDCNDAVDPVRDFLPTRGIALAFIDPTTWQVTFDAITRLTSGRRVDLLFTFHVATMRRMVRVDPRALTLFFGTPEWKAALDRPRYERTEALLHLYNDQLETIGYKPGSHELAIPIRNTRGRPIYYLVLFSKDDLGVRFWRDVGKIPMSGQQRFSLW
jgi:three-Cys-motif partner protein